MQKTDKRYILITGCSNEKYLYNDKIGFIYKVNREGVYNYFTADIPTQGISMKDAIEVSLVCNKDFIYAFTHEQPRKGDTCIMVGYGGHFIDIMGVIEKDNYVYSTVDKKLYAASDPALISDGVLPIKNGDEIMRGMTDEKILDMAIPDRFDNPRNWVEDYVHENGDYVWVCVECANPFHGHKRRVICKVCTAARVAADTDKPDFQDYPETKLDAIDTIRKIAFESARQKVGDEYVYLNFDEYLESVNRIENHIKL